jgi:hypothetical protein
LEEPNLQTFSFVFLHGNSLKKLEAIHPAVHQTAKMEEFEALFMEMQGCSSPDFLRSGKKQRTPKPWRSSDLLRGYVFDIASVTPLLHG